MIWIFITTLKKPNMEISVGHTPDSDDAFMFYGMFTDKVPSPDFTVNHVIEDIENLNLKATNPELDVTAVSVHACAYIPGYTILRSGGSFGINYGPIVTAKKQMTIEELKKWDKMDCYVVLHSDFSSIKNMPWVHQTYTNKKTGKYYITNTIKPIMSDIKIDKVITFVYNTENYEDFVANNIDSSKIIKTYEPKLPICYV